MIPYGRQDIQSEDIEAVLEVLQSDFLTQGPKVPSFETALATHVGARHAVAVNSATSALHIACMALDLGAGDWLWTSPNTFVATANCALYCGAQVDFVDIDPATYNMCPKALTAKLERAEISGTLPKIVAPVAFSGQSCDMQTIHELGQKYGFSILEDASHAIGGKYQGEFVGNGKYADITVFSFHPVKIITTAEGGLAVTQNPELAQKMELARSHGITRDPELMTHASDGPWYYQQVELGYNYRMTELQAALGCAQIKRLDSFVSARAARASIYDTALADLPMGLPTQLVDTASAWHLYVIQLQKDAPLSHLGCFNALRADGLGVNVHYIPMHLQPHYRSMGFKPGDFPAAEAYYKRAISLPLYSAMTDEQQDTVIEVVRKHLA